MKSNWLNCNTIIRLTFICVEWHWIRKDLRLLFFPHFFPPYDYPKTIFAPTLKNDIPRKDHEVAVLLRFLIKFYLETLESDCRNLLWIYFLFCWLKLWKATAETSGEDFLYLSIEIWRASVEFFPPDGSYGFFSKRMKFEDNFFPPEINS